MKFKKFLIIGFVFILTIPFSIGLIGCGKRPQTHTHAFVIEYSVEGSGETIRVKKKETCSCNETKSSYVADDNILVVTPSNAQEILDNNINGKVVVFDGKFTNGEGTADDFLELRPTSTTATAYTFDTTAKTIGEKVALTDLEQNQAYYYKREIKNVVFIGTAETEINRTFLTDRGSMGYCISDFIHNKHDAVKGLNAWQGGQGKNIEWVNDVALENVVFTKLNFRGAKSNLIIHDKDHFGEFLYKTSNIEVSKCSFKEGYKDFQYAGIAFSTNTSDNIIIKHNNIDGYYQGIYTNNIHNVTIDNNTVTNAGHNLIAIQSDPDHYFSGSINITNNVVSNTTDRAIRLGFGKNAKILIENNTFTNCAEDRTQNNQGIQLLKSETLSNCNYFFLNNTYNEESLDPIESKETSFIVYIVKPII